MSYHHAETLALASRRLRLRRGLQLASSNSGLAPIHLLSDGRTPIILRVADLES